MSKQQRDDETIVVKKTQRKDEVSLRMPKEYWSDESPYVEAYIRALNYANYRPVYEENEVSRQEEIAHPVAVSSDKKQKKNKVKKYYKKRKFALSIFAIAMIAALVVGVLGIIAPVSEYVSPFLKIEGEYNAENSDSIKTHPVSFVDPIYSLISMWTKGGDAAVDGDVPEAAEATDANGEEGVVEESTDVISLTDYYLTDILEKQVKDFSFEGQNASDSIKVVLWYVFPFLCVLFLIGCLFLFIKAIVALASKKKKKYKLGFGFFLTFIFLIATAVMGIVWNGNGMTEISECLLYPIGSLFGIESIAAPASNLTFGLGMWIEIVLMVVGLISLCFAYKRIKKPVKEGGKAAAKR